MSSAKAVAALGALVSRIAVLPWSFISISGICCIRRGVAVVEALEIGPLFLL